MRGKLRVCCSHCRYRIDTWGSYERQPVTRRSSATSFAFHGKRGELRQRHREGQEDQLGALGLVVKLIVLWNTIYMEAVVKGELRPLRNPADDPDKTNFGVNPTLVAQAAI